jgi:acid phosphatase type 7
MEEQTPENQTHPEYHQRRFADRPHISGHHMPVQRESSPPHPPSQNFRPLPPPTGPAPYRLSLAEILPPEQIESIRASGRMVFHTAGDTGGVKSPVPQMMVFKQMQRDFEVQDSALHPAFFYHLGDVVYFYGEAQQYYSQFYDPAAHYPAPIFAIPGNHDGDVFDEGTPSLAAFVENFCAPEPYHTRSAGDSVRDAMTQPNVYWTLEAPFVTFIGLYTNVVEGGMLDDEQTAWLESELAHAPQDKALIVAMHHPIYSAEGFHSGSTRMGEVLDHAINRSGRMPDMVLAGHAHNYQRFTRSWREHEIPYFVIGSGGFWQLYPIHLVNNTRPKVPCPIAETDVTLENFCDDRHGYVRIQVTKEAIIGEFIAVPRPYEPWSNPGVVSDSFQLDLRTHRLSSLR